MKKNTVYAGMALTLTACVTAAPNLREQTFGTEQFRVADESVENSKVDKVANLRSRFAETYSRLTSTDDGNVSCDRVKRVENCRIVHNCEEPLAIKEANLFLRVKPDTVHKCTVLSPDSEILRRQCVENETFSESELIDYYREAVSCLEMIEFCALGDTTTYCDPALRGKDFLSYDSYDEMPSAHPDLEINKLIVENKRLEREKEALISAIVADDPQINYFDMVALWANDENFRNLTNEWLELEKRFKTAERPTKAMYMDVLRKDMERIRLIISILKPHYCPAKCSKP